MGPLASHALPPPSPWRRTSSWRQLHPGSWQQHYSGRRWHWMIGQIPPLCSTHGRAIWLAACVWGVVASAAMTGEAGLRCLPADSSSSSVALSWNDQPGVHGYHVRVSLSAREIAQVSRTSRSFTSVTTVLTTARVHHLMANTSYSLAVRGRNASWRAWSDGWGNWSDPINCSTPALGEGVSKSDHSHPFSPPAPPQLAPVPKQVGSLKGLNDMICRKRIPHRCT